MPYISEFRRWKLGQIQPYLEILWIHIHRYDSCSCSNFRRKAVNMELWGSDFTTVPRPQLYQRTDVHANLNFTHARIFSFSIFCHNCFFSEAAMVMIWFQSERLTLLHIHMIVIKYFLDWNKCTAEIKRQDHKPPFKYELQTYPENQIMILSTFVVHTYSTQWWLHLPWYQYYMYVDVYAKWIHISWQDKVEAN